MCGAWLPVELVKFNFCIFSSPPSSSHLLLYNNIIPDVHINARPLKKDNNGSIENEELRGFLKDLLELAKKVRGGNLSAERGAAERQD
jgi:hypothetical protein